MKKPYITKTVNNTFAIFIPYEWIETINATQWTSIIIAMESWAIWKKNIEPNYTGWEFSNELTPESIQHAFKRCSGETAEIILPN
jgi:hypothetical protein